MLYLGVKDLREFEFEIYYLPLAFVLPLLLFCLHSNVLLVASAAVVGTIFAVLMWRGLMGYMDATLVPRIPLVLLMAQRNAFSMVGFVAGMVVAYVLYIYRYIIPALCEKRFAAAFGKIRVRREAVSLKYIYPLDTRAEDENLEDIKKKILESTTERCIDAYAGIPLIFVFSVGYATTFVLSLL